MAFELISIILACAIIVVIVCAFYYFWDASVAGEDADSAEHETQEERAETLARRRAQIDEENERQKSASYSEDAADSS